MAYKVSLHQIEDLAKGDVNNEILLYTNKNITLNIISREDSTVIIFPKGNKFDIINGRIIVYKKQN